MKKVLFLIHDLGHGGAEKVLVNLVNNMDQTKFDITLMTLFDVGVNRQFLSPDIRYLSCFSKMIPGNSHLMKILTPRQLHRWFIKDHYDIEIAYLEGPCARIISGCTDKTTKLISWIHIEQHTKTRIAGSFRSYSEAIKVYSKFHKIICVSETVKDAFIKTTGFGKERFSVLYNTNETEQIIEKSQEAVYDIEFEKDMLNVCSVAKITKTKGYDRLAKVHHRLIKEGLKHHIYILGIGEQQKEIQKYIEDRGLQDTFTFIGFRDNPYKYVAKCDLYVCSSHREGFSTAVTEALVVGTPVISTLCSGAHELLGYHNEYGMIVENSTKGIYQGMKQVLNNPEMLVEMKKQEEKRGTFFSREKKVQAVEKLFKSFEDNEK